MNTLVNYITGSPGALLMLLPGLFAPFYMVIKGTSTFKKTQGTRQEKFSAANKAALRGALKIMAFILIVFLLRAALSGYATNL